MEKRDHIPDSQDVGTTICTRGCGGNEQTIQLKVEVVVGRGELLSQIIKLCEQERIRRTSHTDVQKSSGDLFYSARGGGELVNY